MQIGVVGLGRMGGGIRTRLLAGGHEVVGYDANAAITDTESIPDLVSRLAPPRVVWVMVPAGAATDGAFASLAEALAPRDLAVDGGNSRFSDSVTRAAAFSERNLGFVDAGVSGGIYGAEEGFCVMLGGTAEDVQRLAPALDAIAVPEGWAHVGPAGAGHYAKMCHNAIEYALMQAYAEGFDLLRHYDAPIDAHQVATLWTRGSVIRSWLLELAARALADEATFERLAGYVEDSGEGRWAVHEAVARGVSLPTITESLYRRFESRDDDPYALRLLAALRREFGGHATRETATDV